MPETKPISIREKLKKLAQYAEKNGRPYLEVVREHRAKWATGMKAAAEKAANETLPAERRAQAAQNARDARWVVRMLDLEIERLGGEV